MVYLGIMYQLVLTHATGTLLNNSFYSTDNVDDIDDDGGGGKVNNTIMVMD